ncbi:hypothetical protein LWI29_004009 [Acer saccharum]|uniref:Nuclear pore complex protein NUP1 n=1 Tax=Acer saccharum TaxID=4024 RepID=A0AA39SFC6_ACESA|nr:hypothetical protein LWI29_004009 [Acer saccharum]
MATAREEGGFGAGGKFRKRPFKRTTQTTPYDRPTTILRNSPNINVNNNNGWLSKLVDPAQKLIISSAHRLFGSVFRKRLAPPPPPPTFEPEANHEANKINQELVSTDRPGVQGAINGQDDPYDTSDRGLTELEQILKQKTFTRSEIDRLTALLHSKTDDMHAGSEQKRLEVIPSKSLVSHDRMEASLCTPIKENGSGNQLISMPVVSSSALDEDVASPAELAKSYMGSRPSKVSPSTLGLRSQAFKEESTSMSNRPFFCIFTQSAIYNMARTPYSRLPSTTTLKGAGSSFDSFAGPSSSQSTLEKNGSKQGTLKRRSSVLESDIGSVGPIRRIRQKPNLLTSKSSSLAASGSRLSMRGTVASDAVQQPSSSMQKQLLLGEAKSFAKVLTENKDSSIPITSFTPVPSKSSEMASKILHQLDMLVSPRDKSPMKLSPSMLRGPALKSLENVDSSMLPENVQDNNKLDGSAHTSLPDARDSTSQKQDKVEENGPTKFISSFDKLVPAMNGADAAGNNKDDLAGIKTSDSALTNSNSYPQKKRAFQMSAHEDYLDLDDDDYFSGAVSIPLVEGREKLGASGMENKTVAAEATRVEKPSALSEVTPPSFLLTKTSDLVTSGGSMVAGKSSAFSFTAVPSPRMTPQPALAATASTLTSNKAGSPNETNASLYNFGGKFASPKESNDVSLTFNTSTANVNKIPQFTGVPSSSVVSELPAVKFGASFDSKLGTSTSPAFVADSAIDTILKVPESDKADKQSIPKDGVIFRTPETALPAAASTSASAPSIFSFGIAANSSSLNNGTLDSSPSVTPSSMSLLASNTSTSQNLFNSSTTALSTTDSIAASTTTTSATTTFTAAPIFNFGSSAVLSTSVSPLSATFGVESTEPKTKDAIFGNSTGTPIGGTSAFTTTQSNIFSGTSPVIAGTGSSIFGSTLSAVTSTESSISVGVSTPVTNAGGVFGSTSPITGTGNSIFGFSAGGSSAATSQTLFPNSFTAGSAQDSGAGNNGVVTSTQTVPVQFGSSATSSSFGLAGNPGFSSSSSPFGSSISAAKPFSSASSFGLNSATSLSEANSGSGTTPSVFGSSWQAPKSASLFGSSTSAPFQFNASASSVATNSAPVFGSSTGAPSGSLFPFTSTAAAPSSQPAFGNPSSVNPFGTAPSNNNDQIGMEDSMAEDTIQASTPTVPAFGQQPITPAPSGFGFNMAAQPSPFQFSSQQNVANPQNSTLFQSSNSLEFNAAAAGGSFSLGSGGGDKSNRRIVKIKSKQRRK